MKRFKNFGKRTIDSDTYIRSNPGVKWASYIPITSERSIHYLEIGVRTGENVIDISRSYAKHCDSKIHCIDPWYDYDKYSEYKGIQSVNYQKCMKNFTSENILSKCKIFIDLSENVVPTLEDNSFDIIYVDGNHSTEYVYKDGIMAFQKLKVGGYLIFDDYYPGVWDDTCKGINMFVKEYTDKIRVITMQSYAYGHSPQTIIQKTGK